MLCDGCLLINNHGEISRDSYFHILSSGYFKFRIQISAVAILILFILIENSLLRFVAARATVGTIIRQEPDWVGCFTSRGVG